MARHSRRRCIQSWGASGLSLMAAVLSACKQAEVPPAQATRAAEAGRSARSGDGAASVAPATRPLVLPHVGYLFADAEPTSGGLYSSDVLGFEWCRQRLGQLGWRVGRDLIMTSHYAAGRLQVLPDLVAELVRLEVSIILADGPEAARAVVEVGTTTPTVIVVGADLTRPQLFGVTTRPSTITGIAFETPDLPRRRLSLLKEALPQLSQLAILWNGANWAAAEMYGAVESAARDLGLQPRALEVRTVQDIEGVLTGATGTEAFIVVNDPLTSSNRARIALFAERRRLRVVFERRSGQYSEGALLEVGPDVQEMFSRAATYVDQLVRGARAADLPMEQPDKLDLVVNLKTAQALGLTIPQSVLTQATQIIQ